MQKKISVANLIMLAGAVVTFLFSFFNFYKSGKEGRSAWSTDLFSPVSLVPVLLAIAMIVWVVLELVGTKLPDHVLTFTSNQLKATWGIAAGGLMLAWLITDPLNASLDKGIGLWFMLIGSLAMAVGSVMALLGKGTEMVGMPRGATGTSSPPTAPMGGGSPPPPPPYGGSPTPPPPPPV